MMQARHKFKRRDAEMQRLYSILHLCISAFFLILSYSTLSAKNTSDSISVYIFLHEECVISQYYTLPLRELHDQYANEHFQFVGVFPSFSSKKENIQAFKEKYKIPFLLKTDYFKTKTKLLDATVTPEVVVYNEHKKSILYRGRIDNTYFRVGKKRTITTTSDLADALEAITNHQPIQVATTQPIGCFINRKELSN